jgi:rRNA processing protein Gar1
LYPDRLFRLGAVLHKSTGSNNLILRAENSALPGDPVVDKSLKRIGIVMDMFGPINNPYISVRPSTPDYHVGEILYKLAQEKKRGGRAWKKR